MNRRQHPLLIGVGFDSYRLIPIRPAERGWLEPIYVLVNRTATAWNQDDLVTPITTEKVELGVSGQEWGNLLQIENIQFKERALSLSNP